jgi:TonB-dependent SusC/RagA subfamily outer membrane receptor
VIEKCSGSHYDQNCYAEGITDDEIKANGGGTEAVVRMLRRKGVSVDDNLNMRIRSARTSVATGGRNPLFVLDGMILPEGTTGKDFLDLVNQNDIGSIVVLKNVEDTAIYGSRGANGVIIVRLKR